MASKENWSDPVTKRPPATFPTEGIYATGTAEEIYLDMRRPEVSPNGLGSAIQMCVFYVNRAGRNLNQHQKRRILKAVEYLRLEHNWLKLQDRLNLKNEPKPVYPMPPPSRRVGGRYANPTKH